MNILNNENLKTAQHAINGLPKKAYCIVCGELEIKDGQVIHPELDKAYAKMLENSFSTKYTYTEHKPTGKYLHKVFNIIKKYGKI